MRYFRILLSVPAVSTVNIVKTGTTVNTVTAANTSFTSASSGRLSSIFLIVSKVNVQVVMNAFEEEKEVLPFLKSVLDVNGKVNDKIVQPLWAAPVLDMIR